MDYDYDEYIKRPLPFIRELRKYFRKRDRITIFEIGSCEGEDTIRLKKAFPNAEIYTFEPLPKNVSKIKKNFSRYGLVSDKVFEMALSNTDGAASFYVSSGHPGELPKTKDWDYGNKSSSLLAPKEHKKILKWVKFDQKIKVKTARLDSFCKKHRIDSIDFVYLDVQGAELMVMAGAGDMIKNIKTVWMEVESVELYKNQPLKNEVEKFMSSNGFTKLKDTVDEVSGDQLYVRHELTRRSSLVRFFEKLIRKYP